MSDYELFTKIALGGVLLWVWLVLCIVVQHIYWLMRCPGGYKTWWQWADPKDPRSLGKIERYACWKKGDNIERFTSVPSKTVGVIGGLTFFMFVCVLAAVLNR